MTTLERIELLVPVIARFPEMGEFGNVESLLELVRTELGSEDALERSSDQRRAPRRLLHIISANTAMAGMQSLARGLILGSMNQCKTPSVGLPRFEEMVNRLPGSLGALVELSAHLPTEWLERADAVVVFGSDETVDMFRAQIRADQLFAGYGSRWSGACIFDDPTFESVVPLAQDICLYEQMGCLSAQIVWLHQSIDAVQYARHLSIAMQQFCVENDIAPLELHDAASVARWRVSAEWKAVEHPGSQVWLSKDEPSWGVLLIDENQLPGLSCLHRHVTLAPFSDRPNLADLASSVSTLGIWPLDEINAQKTGSVWRFTIVHGR